jgi:5-oxoprolinase (ATP-hydrolysing) subunit A
LEGDSHTMISKINLNADMGEGFGPYDIGDDEALLKIIRSANVACGFHAGDPVVMRRLVKRAQEEGVSIGAHPGFNDISGFGRRRIDMNPTELEYGIAYQIGALQAIAAYAGLEVTHVKPHGALNNMAAENRELADAIGRAIKTVDRNLIYVALAGSEMEKSGEALGLTLAREAFADRTYEDDGNLTSRKIEGSVVRDPQVATARVVEMVKEQAVTSRSGKRIPCKIDSICVHGDEPTAVAVAKAVRTGLEAAGIAVVTLPEMDLS